MSEKNTIKEIIWEAKEWFLAWCPFWGNVTVIGEEEGSTNIFLVKTKNGDGPFRSIKQDVVKKYEQPK